MPLELDKITITQDLIDDIRFIRNEVFTIEQKIKSEIDFDGSDTGALHICGYLDGKIAAYCRLKINGAGAKAGRMCVLKKYRKNGLGRQILTVALDAASQRNIKTVTLNAQISAEGFYKSLGFYRVGEPFIEADIPHVKMIKDL